MGDNKDKNNKRLTRDKSDSICFCWCNSTTTTKKTTQSKPKTINSKDNSFNLNTKGNDNNVDVINKALPKNTINDNKEAIIKPNPNEENQNPIDEVKQLQDSICKTEDKGIGPSVKKDKDKEEQTTQLKCLEPKLDIKAIDNESSIEAGSPTKDNKPSQILQNLELKFNLVSNDTKKSCINYSNNNRMIMTEETPKKFNNNSLVNPNPFMNHLELKNCQTNRDKQLGIDIDSIQFQIKEEEQSPQQQQQQTVKKTVTANDTSNIINEKNGIEFTFKRQDNLSINNEIVHPHIDIKHFNSSTINNEQYSKMQEKISSIPDLISKTQINNQLDSQQQQQQQSNHQLNPKPNDINTNTSIALNQIDTTKPTLNYININDSNINNKNDTEEVNADLSIENDEHYCINDEQDDQDIKSKNDNISKYSETKSIISSYVLAVPRMISGINDSYAQSTYTHSEYKETTSNFLPTEGSHRHFNFIPHNADDTEFEITNENGEGFRNFIETPRIGNVNFKKSNGSLSNSNSNTNPQFKEIYDKINHKTREIKRLNDKIAKMCAEIQKCEEENKKYDRWIEKEEQEGEMLRHMINFQCSK